MISIRQKNIKIMKAIHFAIIMATLTLVGCGERPTPKENNSKSKGNEPKYYAYNPKDTIGNKPYQQMLGIDSVRAEYLFGESMEPLSIEGMDVSNDSIEQVYADAETAWYKMLEMCSKKQYEDMLSYYNKNEVTICLGLGTSSNKFDLDYFVLGRLLLDQFDSMEATEQLAKWLELDKLLADAVVENNLSEGGSGYIPPQYAFQIEKLCQAYTILEEKEKAEDLIEPYGRAVYLLSDDIYINEGSIAQLKFDIYDSFGETAKALEAVVGYRDFLIQYAKDTRQNFDDEIESLEELIKELRSEN